MYFNIIFLLCYCYLLIDYHVIIADYTLYLMMPHGLIVLLHHF